MVHKLISFTVDVIKSEHKYCSDKCSKNSDHLYSLRVPYGCSYEELYEVLSEITDDIKKYEQDVKAFTEKSQSECENNEDKGESNG